MDMDIAVAERARRIIELWVYRQIDKYGRGDEAWVKRLDQVRADAYEEAMRELGA